MNTPTKEEIARILSAPIAFRVAKDVECQTFVEKEWVDMKLEQGENKKW